VTPLLPACPLMPAPSAPLAVDAASLQNSCVVKHSGQREKSGAKLYSGVLFEVLPGLPGARPTMALHEHLAFKARLPNGHVLDAQQNQACTAAFCMF